MWISYIIFFNSLKHCSAFHFTLLLNDFIDHLNFCLFNLKKKIIFKILLFVFGNFIYIRNFCHWNEQVFLFVSLGERSGRSELLRWPPGRLRHRSSLPEALSDSQDPSMSKTVVELVATVVSLPAPIGAAKNDDSVARFGY